MLIVDMKQHHLYSLKMSCHSHLMHFDSTYVFGCPTWGVRLPRPNWPSLTYTLQLEGTYYRSSYSASLGVYWEPNSHMRECRATVGRLFMFQCNSIQYTSLCCCLRKESSCCPVQRKMMKVKTIESLKNIFHYCLLCISIYFLPYLSFTISQPPLSLSHSYCHALVIPQGYIIIQHFSLHYSRWRSLSSLNPSVWEAHTSVN